MTEAYRSVSNSPLSFPPQVRLLPDSAVHLHQGPVPGKRDRPAVHVELRPGRGVQCLWYRGVPVDVDKL